MRFVFASDCFPRHPIPMNFGVAIAPAQRMSTPSTPHAEAIASPFFQPEGFFGASLCGGLLDMCFLRGRYERTDHLDGKGRGKRLGETELVALVRGPVVRAEDQVETRRDVREV